MRSQGPGDAAACGDRARICLRRDGAATSALAAPSRQEICSGQLGRGHERLERHLCGAFAAEPPAWASAPSRRVARSAGPQLAGSNAIEGKVSELASPFAALEGIEVCAVEAGTTSFPKCTSTAAGGTYALPLPDATYEVAFLVPPFAKGNFAPQYFEGTESRAGATHVVLKGTTPATGIDAKMAKGGEIAGSVTEKASAHDPIEEVEACAFPVPASVYFGFLFECGLTDINGAYTISSLGTGEYEVEFLPPKGPTTCPATTTNSPS